MAKQHGKLKLGKGTTFVKSRLRYLPQSEEVWEVDFQPVPDSCEPWIGVVIEQEHGALLAFQSLGDSPTVNDLAMLLGDAMRRPQFGDEPCRPQTVWFLDNPEWHELFPHLRQLKIEVVLTEQLPQWDDAIADFIDHREGT